MKESNMRDDMRWQMAWPAAALLSLGSMLACTERPPFASGRNVATMSDSIGINVASTSDATDAASVATKSTLVDWPKRTGNRPVGTTIRVKHSFDGGMARFYGIDDLGTNDQDEHQGALFVLDDGATLSNVILGDPAADGIHCNGSCTLNNVWWERVGEDAATFRGKTDSAVMTVNGGGASGAVDKVFQHNGRGTMIIKNFYVEWFGKLWRSCGNCRAQYKRHVIVENVTAIAGPKSKALVGVNVNYGDVAEFRGTNTVYDRGGKVAICLKYEGNATGLEPREVAAGPDDVNCRYDNSSVVVRH
jgi:hypothetical protein